MIIDTGYVVVLFVSALLIAILIGGGIIFLVDAAMTRREKNISIFAVCLGFILAVGFLGGPSSTEYQYDVPMNWSGTTCNATLQDGRNISTNTVLLNTDGKSGIQINTATMWFGLIKCESYKAIVAVKNSK